MHNILIHDEMSGRHEDPVEILDDDSEANNMDEAGPSNVKGQPEVANDDDDDEDPEEYNVEAIRARRKNPKTGVEEYFIKWEGFPETDNTWEPLENLKCPEMIQKFKENERNKRRKKKADKLGNSSQQPTKRLRRDNNDSVQGSVNGNEDTMVDDNLFLENDDDDDEDDDNREVLQPKPRGRPPKNVEQITQKGFDRGIPLERIISACYGDDKKLYFFIKWQGLDALELVDVDELKDKAAFQLCEWYQERLMWRINNHVPE